jgi:hypothetical protein
LIDSLALSNGNVAFVARNSNALSRALFAVRGGVVERVVGTGDQLGPYAVDTVGGGNEMRHGDSIALYVLGVGNVPSIWRADYGAPAISASAMISNGSFASGLTGWAPSATGAVTAVGGVGGPAAQLTADPSGGPAGPASITQTIDTPNNSYMVFFDYRFTTTTGPGLDVIPKQVVLT